MNNWAIEEINNEKASCIVVKDNKALHKAEGKGIKPLLNIYINNKEDLKESFVVDKVIGKAAAIIICNSNVKSVYAKRISKGAIGLLKKYNIEAQFKEEVEYIQNMDKSDLCPLEKTVKDINNLDEGIEAIINFINRR